MRVWTQDAGGKWTMVSEREAWSLAMVEYAQMGSAQVAGRRAKAAMGLRLLALKCALLADPAYAKATAGQRDRAFAAKLADKGFHRMKVKRALRAAVEWADQPVMGGKEKQVVVLAPLCEAWHVAQLAHPVWPEAFSGQTARWDAERHAWLERQAREHAARLAGAAAGDTAASKEGRAVDFADLPLFMERAKARLAAGELSRGEAERVRAAFALIRRVGAGDGGVVAAARGALIA